MRHSTRVTPFSVKKAGLRSKGNEAFFRDVDSELCKDHDEHFGVLLVGGSDAKSLAVRQAQAVLRYDHLSSYWSHCAVVLRWEKGKPGEAIGVEVALDPETPADQVPERNGVTLFRLGRYFDSDLYPNVCFFTVCGLPKEMKTFIEIEKALLDPNRERLRYPIWRLLGEWHRYIHRGDGGQNPLLEGYPFPAAALCEYAFEAGGLDLTTGATAPNTCPETLWQTLRRWESFISTSSKGSEIKLQGWKLTRDETGSRKTLSYRIELPDAAKKTSTARKNRKG